MTTEKSAATREANSKLWLDFGPLLVFFGAFHYFKRENPDEAIIWAAGVLAIAATIALAWSWFKHKQTSPILIFSTIVIGAFALLALFFDDKRIIFMKPTFMNTLFGLALLAGIVLKKNFMKIMMGSAFEMADKYWNTQAIRWAIFFFVLAVLNEVIWRNFSESFWTGFKVFGFFPLTILFTLSQIPFLHKHATMKK